MASYHVSGMEHVFQMWMLSANMFLQLTRTGDKTRFYSLEVDLCLKPLTVKKAASCKMLRRSCHLLETS